MSAAEVMTEKEAAEFLRVSPHTLKKWRRDGKVPSLSLGRPRYLRDSLLEHLKSLEKPAETAIPRRSTRSHRLPPRDHREEMRAVLDL